jgi:hypothetical protein
MPHTLLDLPDRAIAFAVLAMSAGEEGEQDRLRRLPKGSIQPVLVVGGS